MIFAIKMLLDYTNMGLLKLLEFKCNHFFLANSECKNPNFGGEQLEIMSFMRASSQKTTTLVGIGCWLLKLENPEFGRSSQNKL